MSEGIWATEWLGHWDMCAIQWGEPCTCKPAVRFCGNLGPHDFHPWQEDGEDYVCGGEVGERPYETTLSDDVEPGDLG